VFAVGGGTRWAQALVALVVAGILAFVATSQRQLKRVSPLVALLAIAAALTVIQIIPLPSAVLELLNSTGSTLRDEGAALAGVSPHPAISMDAPGSLRAIAAFITMLGVAVLALRTAVSERKRFKLVAAVGAACGLAAIVSGLHVVVGATSLYGVIEVPHHPHVLGPLLNLNHLGCLVAIGTVVSIGLAAYPHQPSWMRALWFANAAGCGVLAVYTVSRGATIALIAGALVTIAILVGQRFVSREQGPRRGFATGSLPIAIVALCALVVVVYSSASTVEKKFEATSLQELHEPSSKFGAWRTSLHIIEESPWFGVGRGGFEPYFTRLHPTSGKLTYSHVENEYLQAVLDWGIVGGALLALAAVWFGVSAIRRWRDGPLAAAAIGGLSVLLVQSIVDFGAEIFGLAVPGILLASTLVYVPLREASGREETRRALALRIAHVVGLLGGCVLLLTSVTTTVAEDHERLGAIESRDFAAVEEAIADAIERHPLDYYGYAVAAELAFRRNDADGVRLLNHAMRLNPSHGGLHRIAARRLRRAGHLQQAALEYSVALRYSNSPTTMLEEIAKELPLSHAAAAIPVDLPKPEQVIAVLQAARRDDLANEWLARVARRRHDNTIACELLVRRARENGDGRAAAIVAGDCMRSLTDAGARMAVANVLVRDNRVDDALAVVKDVASATGSIEERHVAWQYLCEAHRRRRDFDAASTCLLELQASPELPEGQRQSVVTLIALIAEERKNPAPQTQ
jgi:O-antigen ligase